MVDRVVEHLFYDQMDGTAGQRSFVCTTDRLSNDVKSSEKCTKVVHFPVFATLRKEFL